jgi:hypothetical protein
MCEDSTSFHFLSGMLTELSNPVSRGKTSSIFYMWPLKDDGWYEYDEYEKVKVLTWDCQVEDHMMIDYAKTFLNQL